MGLCFKEDEVPSSDLELSESIIKRVDHNSPSSPLISNYTTRLQREEYKYICCRYDVKVPEAPGVEELSCLALNNEVIGFACDTKFNIVGIDFLRPTNHV